MATFRRRLPSRREVVMLFAACAFPVHVWAIVNLLREPPAWLLRLSGGELAGVIAYALNFALVESLLLLGLVLLPKPRSRLLDYFSDANARLCEHLDIALREWADG